ncbi:DNA-binding protein [Nitrosopumilus sp. K4]|uniref:DNA-binding protein n=1 Tax=Nitrosopumilus sp. K4 TaxID=2795383 RepID=UPI001BAAAE82|nr:DNA-binding protein [Nitrosopumilus sp. K4]QUC65519.1 DNA-binding protein [Nitrosopumilus sp. K4]
MSNDTNDVIFIGKKPLMTYVNSAIIQLSSIPEITLKARGYTMGLAIDVSQVILRKTKIFEIGTIKVSSEQLVSADGRKRDVSTIEIPIKRIS